MSLHDPPFPLFLHTFCPPSSHLHPFVPPLLLLLPLLFRVPTLPLSSPPTLHLPPPPTPTPPFRASSLSYHPSASLHYSSISYRPPNIPSLLASLTPSFSKYVSLDPVRFSLIWVFTVCLCSLCFSLFSLPSCREANNFSESFAPN